MPQDIWRVESFCAQVELRRVVFDKGGNQIWRSNSQCGALHAGSCRALSLDHLGKEMPIQENLNRSIPVQLPPSLGQRARSLRECTFMASPVHLSLGGSREVRNRTPLIIQTRSNLQEEAASCPSQQSNAYRLIGWRAHDHESEQGEFGGKESTAAWVCKVFVHCNIDGHGFAACQKYGASPFL
jgi:hypothetical protein